MKSIQIYFVIALSAFIMAGCTTPSILTRKQAYPEMYRDPLLSILVMPPINKTNKVEAKEYFFTTLNQPLCEKGYYVIPSYLSMEIFKNESAYDADLFIDRPMDKFANYFGADIVLFTVIHQWEKMALSGKITVEVEYIAKSTKTNTVIYTRKGTMILDTSVQSVQGGGIAGALIQLAATAIVTATTPHVKAARACNTYALSDFPSGKYNPACISDSTLIAGEKTFNATIQVNK